VCVGEGEKVELMLYRTCSLIKGLSHENDLQILEAKRGFAVNRFYFCCQSCFTISVAIDKY
jgi:hypothetical protein